MAESREPYPSEKQERFIVRLPDGMRDWLRDEAARNKRSMNAEIVYRLDQSKLHDGQPVIPAWIIDLVTQEAEANGQSVSQEIAKRIEWSLQARAEVAPDMDLAPLTPETLGEVLLSIQRELLRLRRDIESITGQPPDSKLSF